MKDGTVYLCSNCHEDRHGGTYANEVAPIERQRQSQRMKKRWQDPRWRKKQLASYAKRGRNAWSPEANEKRRKASRALAADPQFIAKLKAAQREARRKGHWPRNEVSRKMRLVRRKLGHRWLLKDRQQPTNN